MFLIAHRGNTEGENKEEENKEEYILKALSQGYDVEIDVWVIKTFSPYYKIFLGHDNPKYEIKLDFLLEHKEKLWCSL